jgi:AcrR family transcriptional regulator
MAGRPREFDVDTALDIALRLFWRHGYEGTSIAMLADAIGIKVPSLYMAFGNKEGLFREALGLYGSYSGKVYLEAFKKRTPREIAEAVFEGAIELVAGPATPEGCLMIQGALATSPAGDRLRLEIAAMRREAEAALAERLQQASQEEPFPHGINAASFAAFIMTMNAGLAVQAKSGASPTMLRNAVSIAMSMWPQWDDSSQGANGG